MNELTPRAQIGAFYPPKTVLQPDLGPKTGSAALPPTPKTTRKYEYESEAYERRKKERDQIREWQRTQPSHVEERREEGDVL